MWPVALEAMLGVLGLKILLIEEDAATARTLALRTPVDHGQAAFRQCLADQQRASPETAGQARDKPFSHRGQRGLKLVGAFKQEAGISGLQNCLRHLPQRERESGLARTSFPNSDAAPHRTPSFGFESRDVQIG
jgi:hypothetical protein